MNKTWLITGVVVVGAIVTMADTATAQTHTHSLGPAPESHKLAPPAPPAGGVSSVHSPMDSGFGQESQDDFLAEVTLNAPGTLINRGPAPELGDFFVSAAEFGNDGDFSFIYLLDFGNTLYTRSTVDGSLVNNIGVATPVSGTFSGLAMDQATGIMYACSSDITTSTLYTINLATAVATPIGPLPGMPGALAIAIDPADGQMYGYDLVVDALFRIDKTSGATTLVGGIGFDANFGQGLDFDDSDGTLYMSAFNNDTFQSELRTVNTATGMTTLVPPALGSVSPGGVHQLGGFAIATQSPAAIPTVSEWGLIVMTLLLLVAGTIVIRRVSAQRSVAA